MEMFDSLLLGTIQGLTEFLPISSSGHLYVTEILLGLVPDLHFELSLHVASLGAVLVLFRRRIWQIMRGLITTCGGACGHREQGILGWKLIVATVATVPVALLIEPFFADWLTVRTVGVTLILTGALIVLSEKYRPGRERPFSWPFAILLGLVQGLAPIPGISRSGLTIALMIWYGIERRRAAEISFLLAIPTILGALVFALWDDPLAMTMSPSSALACLASFVAAILAMGWMMKLVEKHWIWFAPYCVGAGVVVLVWLT